jgi:hypothetical protein
MSRRLRAALAAALGTLFLGACGGGYTGPTADDTVVFDRAWEQQTETDKNTMCAQLAVIGEDGVAAAAASSMERPGQFARLLTMTCMREGR